MRRLKIFEWLLLLTIAIGAGPATSAMYQWSTTAGTNATADPSINWAEGMSPSSINDSARAMMAVLAGCTGPGRGVTLRREPRRDIRNRSVTRPGIASGGRWCWGRTTRGARERSAGRFFRVGFGFWD
jgi:hypothetical protein